MGNQLGVAVATRPGDAVLLEPRAHIACWEVAGAAAHFGVQLVGVEAPDGLPSIGALEAALLPDHPRAPQVSLLCIENSHNGAGGLVHSGEAIAARVRWAHARDIAVHIDGARLFNAAIALGVEPAALVGRADSVSVCLSKGLGAPVGSVFCASRERLAAADRVRHRLGGGWRQAGVLAAAGLYALHHHVAGLADDHARAARLAEALVRTGLGRPLHEVVTNIVYFEVHAPWGTAATLERRLRAEGVLIGATGEQTARLVTHRDVDDAGVERAIAALERLL
jgi:threonine aldolase